MMEGRRVRRFSRGHNHTLLPLRLTHLTNTVSCWYCDFKTSAFNDPLFHFGRRYSRFLRVWFSVGIGFSLATLLGITLVLLWELARDLRLFSGNNQLSSILSGSLFGYSPSVFSLADVGYMCISTVIAVSTHELGHALAAASEGIQIEYIAVFLAVLFPGALVAFNHELLLALPRVAALRIYCAGIWHNAAFCAICALALFLMPLILYPIYVHDENPMVLDLSPTSPLMGYISPGDLIVSLDGVRIHNAKDWIQMTTMLHEQALGNSKNYNDLRGLSIIGGRKGYCVSSSLIQESKHIPSIDEQTTCPTELSTFTTISCLPSSTMNDTITDYNHEERRDDIHCMSAKNVVELKKCGDGWIETASSESGCPCSEDESCLAPIQMPGQTWVEIKYSTHSRKCQPLGQRSFPGGKKSDLGEMGCGGTFVFIGDMISMAQSVQLTSYQPRWSFPFAADLPVVIEKLLMYTFHVSLMLALLNSLPVYFLDGESIVEGALCYVRFLSPRQRGTLVQSFLVGGTCISIIVIARIFFLFIL